MSDSRPHLATLVSDFERHGSQVAVVAARGLRHEPTTYAQLAALCRRFAAELERRNIQKGDRVLLWGENSAEWIAVFFGCVMRGVLPVPIDNAGTREFARRVEQEVSPKLIAADDSKLALLASGSAAVRLPRLRQSITVEQATVTPELVSADPLQIVFTSGTTAEPKGVVHTHRNVLASLLPIETEIKRYLKYERLVHPLRFLHTLPLSHVFGQFIGLWIPGLLAAEVHYESRLVASEMIDRIREQRISMVAAVPRALDLLRSSLEASYPELTAEIEAARHAKAWQRWWRFRRIHRLFGWKFWSFVCGGASLPLAAEQFWHGLGFLVIQGYGMTETTALISLNHPFRSARGSVGQVLPGREVRLAADGEVLVRGETISNTIWQQGELHERETPWLATGDLASFDEQGNLRFKGRKKDVIVTSAGLNIHPEDLEAALVRQPGVNAATVIETQTAAGPEAVPVLVLTPGSDPARAIEAANGELAAFQHMNRWIVWPEPDFPRTSTGKVLRREVARLVESSAAAYSDANENADLNLDSLGRVELQAKLEQQYGISVDDTVMQSVKTQGDVQAILSAQRARGAKATHRQNSRHIYPKWPWNPVMQAIRSLFLEGIAMPLLRFLTKANVRRKNEVWPESPMLIVANHVTSYDVPLILYALPGKVRRRVAVAMSAEMILDWRRARNQGHWFLNLVAPIEYFLVTGLFNVFPLPQMSGFRQSFAHAAAAMDRGFHVIVFPEGHRSPDGNRQPFKAGTGLLWGELGCPALPVRLEGLGELKVSRETWFRSRRITVVVNPLVESTPGKSPAELTQILESDIFRQ